MKISVRFLLIGLIALFGILFFIKPSFAQAQSNNLPVNYYASPNTNPDVPNNLHTWTQSVMIEVMSSMICQLSGKDIVNRGSKCIGIDSQTGKLGFVQEGGGAIGIMGNLIAATLTPPIHTSQYIAYLYQNFGIAKPSYAAGLTGFQSLSPIMGIWVIFRNIVYLLFVLIFLVIGIAIMLRIKIDPRTVMTIQNQIPKIIIGLVLVTFSFAIAGFLIDIMWLVIYLFINVLSRADPTLAQNAGTLTGNLNNNSLSWGNRVFDGGLLGVAGGAASSIGSIILNLVSGGGGQQSAGNVVDIILSPLTTVLGAVLGFIGGIAAFFIILIALLWSMFKLWFALLSAYIFILVDIIFAPFWIVTGLLPGGQSMGFSAWLRDILGNLAAFPATIAMFLIGKVIIDNFGTNGSAQAFLPPLIGNPATGGTNVFASLIALGIIFTTPHVVKITKAAFKSPKIDLGPIEESVGAGQAVVGGFVGGANKSLFRRDQYGRAEGPGAQFVQSHISERFAKNFLGWRNHNYNPMEIREALEKHKGNENPAKAATAAGTAGEESPKPTSET